MGTVARYQPCQDTGRLTALEQHWKNRHRCRRLHKRLKSRDARAGIGYLRAPVLWRYALNGGYSRRQGCALKVLAGKHTLEEVDPSPFFCSPYEAKNPFWRQF